MIDLLYKVNSYVGFIPTIVLLLCFLFSIFIVFTKYGNIRAPGERLNIGAFSYCAIAFCMGQGVSLFFWGVEEPLLHMKDGRMGFLEAISNTLTEWAWAPWMGYAIATIAFLGMYKIFIKGESKKDSRGDKDSNPSTTEVGFSPNRLFRGSTATNIFKWVLIISSINAISLSFAYAPIRINQFSALLGFEIPKLAVIIAIFILGILSYMLGVLRGIKNFSVVTTSFNIFILLAVVCNANEIFDYLSKFIASSGLSLANTIPVFLGFTYSLEELQTWVWTNSGDYLIWSIPVGLFLARVSQGRTLREIILGIAIIPSLWHCLWFTCMSYYANSHGFTEVKQVLSDIIAGNFFLLLSIITMFLMVVTTLDSMLVNLGNIYKKIKAYWYCVPMAIINILILLSLEDLIVPVIRQVSIISGGLLGIPLIYFFFKGIGTLNKNDKESKDQLESRD